MNFINTVFDCCFRSKEFKLHPEIEKELEEEKVSSGNTKDKKNPKTIKDKENSETIKDKKENSITNKDKENSKTIKDKENPETIKDTQKDKNEVTPIGSSPKNFSSLSATLQCLLNINRLNEYFKGTFPKSQDYEKKQISYEYYKLIQKLSDENNNNKIPYSSLITFKENLIGQNILLKAVETNSVDLFMALFSSLQGEINIKNSENNLTSDFYNLNYNEIAAFKASIHSKSNSIISDLFSVVTETIDKCTICNNLKYNFSFSDYIIFHLEKVKNYLSYNLMGSNYTITNNQNFDISLLQCFEYYNNYIELNNGMNQLYCGVCNISSDQYSQNIVYSLPQNLIIYLNRGKDDICNSNVIFQENLNLFNYAKDNRSNTILELHAFICDINESSDQQHFVAYCKNQEDKRWYLYDGDLVSSCERPWENHKGMVYILFYRTII